MQPYKAMEEEGSATEEDPRGVQPSAALSKMSASPPGQAPPNQVCQILNITVVASHSSTLPILRQKLGSKARKPQIVTFPICDFLLVYRTEMRPGKCEYPRVCDKNEPHDDVIKWKHFPRYWLFVRGIHRSPVNSPHKGQWCWALIFSLICVWINGWVNKVRLVIWDATTPIMTSQ